LLLILQEKTPYLFDDIEYDHTFYDKYLSDDRWREYISKETTDEGWETVIEGTRHRFAR
jgi:hypothetical protein